MSRAVIDACSVIYLIKTGPFERLSAELNLVTTEEVYREIGWGFRSDGQPKLKLELVPAPPDARSHDHGLYRIGLNKNLPLISDDFDLLSLARDAGLEYYNSLMMLIFLEYRGRISGEDYSLYRERLMDIAYYSDEIVSRAESYRSDLFR